MTIPSELERRVRSAPAPLERIHELVRVLRGPAGCPWDREQTLATLTPYLQEETYEVVEAVGATDPDGVREELGDLLFLVLLVSDAAEASGITLDSVADAVVDKLVRRHPHVFGGGPGVGSDGALRQWEELKREESSSPVAARSVLGDRPPGLPALTTAFRISEKAGAVGFQWPTTAQALDKVEEEARELRAEIDAGANPRAVEDELGDLLYAAANLARYLGIDPERALRGTIAKFSRRFRHLESALASGGRTPSDASLNEMQSLWEEAKAAETR